MNDAPNRSITPNWVETPDGEIMPPESGLNDEQEHQASVERHRAENPGYVEWTDINPVEYDLDEAATIGALHQPTQAREELYGHLTKSELEHLHQTATPEIRAEYKAGTAAARAILDKLQGGSA